MQSQVQKPFNILNKDFLMACQLEAIGQLKEKGITEAEIMANPKLFAEKVYEVIHRHTGGLESFAVSDLQG